jgi:hypothetical protein
MPGPFIFLVASKCPGRGLVGNGSCSSHEEVGQ